mgnify:CR=1 FL=1
MTSTSIGPVKKERSDLPIAYVRAGSSVRGLDHSPIGTVASLLETRNAVYKKEIKISNVIPNPNPVGVGESIEKAFLPVLLAQASSQMSMPGMSFQKDSCLLEVKLVHGYTLYSSRERISYAWLKA